MSNERWDRAVVSSTNGRIHVPKDIINLVKDVRLLLAIFKASRIKYRNKIINKEVDVLVKMTHPVTLLYLVIWE